MENLIYGLRDPRDDLYYYIGKTKVGKNRPISHLHYSHNKKVKEWVSELKKFNLEPYIDIIEENIDINDLRERERYWISEYKKINDELFNEQLVDDRIYSLSEVNWDRLEDVGKFLSNLPSFIKGLRIRYNLTQIEIAELCGVSKLTLAKVERYNYQKIPLSLVIRLVNLNPEDFVRKHKSIRINRTK